MRRRANLRIDRVRCLEGSLSGARVLPLEFRHRDGSGVTRGFLSHAGNLGQGPVDELFELDAEGRGVVIIELLQKNLRGQ